MGTIIAYIVIGLIGGAIAKAIMPGTQGGGWLATMALGIVGALLGGFLGGLLFNVNYSEIFSFQGLITSIVGALIVLAIWGFVAKRRA
ncbi:GlsB/YeaQ/YmgE family stress response membrane protein [Propioniciclava coleopterorum]|uniref:GlsB/YeaQ/YmgE family stress response membrane protein n=1 Tax=Propioniciclava coleopterorum TaxID=2714937 RepID=A0A6G7Y8D6_9ACTN|nr:GlsB/YeaQ/YmgE family stress response membrane protein [Propioniciclava coleopterorum]QIK73040.1 GlsB/YeaQ/YmgE family stress response membrane protein [Propioniciclava coleopterorum]